MKFRLNITRPPPKTATLLVGATAIGVLSLALLAGALTAALAGDRSTQVQLQGQPLGLPPVKLEKDVTLDAVRIELGRKLFFDRRLSFNGTMSCAMCHVPEEGFASNASRRGVGIEGVSLKRNAPSLLNVAWRQRQLFLDGRETSLISQAWMPLLHVDEMANPSAGHVIEKIKSLRDYQGLFENAFNGAAPSMDTVGSALGSFQLTLMAADSDFDRWMYGGKAAALSPEAQAGYRLFAGKALCVQCHAVGKADALFSDNKYYVTGAGPIAKPMQPFTVPLAPGVETTITDSVIEGFIVRTPPDLGRFDITHVEADRYAFRTPTLRDIARTAPYMHDGSLLTLKAVVDFYDRGGGDVVGKSEKIVPLELTAEEKDQLIAFLLALNSNDYQGLIARSRAGMTGDSVDVVGYSKH